MKTVGVLFNFTSVTHGSTVQYDCDDGYEIQSGNTSLYCDAGNWTGEALACDLIGKQATFFLSSLLLLKLRRV